LRRLGTAFTVATAGMAAFAATSQAASVGITPVKPCYITGEVDTLAGAGYTPGGIVDIAVDGTSVFTVDVDTAGNFFTPLQFGAMKAVKTHTLTATDTTDPALTAAVNFVGTIHQVTFKPQQGPAATKRKMRGYGFLNGPKAYMHVRGHGRRTNVFVGRPKGVCGTWGPTRKRMLPANAATGVYKVIFDAKKKFSKNTTPRVVYDLTVTRKFNAFGAGQLDGWTKVAG
jgi:hypothetical protein